MQGIVRYGHDFALQVLCDQTRFLQFFQVIEGEEIATRIFISIGAMASGAVFLKKCKSMFRVLHEGIMDRNLQMFDILLVLRSDGRGGRSALQQTIKEKF